MVYNYDIGGNILSISKYDYTIDSECINPNTVITYTYDQNYKDRLITYKNEQVTYDENNNITSFDGCTLSYIKDIIMIQKRSCFGYPQGIIHLNFAIFSGTVYFARKFDWSKVDWRKLVPPILVPVVPLYPYY